MDDLAGAMAALGAKGVAFLGPLEEGKATRIANFADPDGNPVYIFEMRKSG